MRAHLFDGVTAVVSAVLLMAAITEGGPVCLVAALAAVFFEGSVTRLWQAFVDSLNPRTDAEAKYLRRVGRDILERHRQKEVQESTPATDGGA